MKKSNRLMHYVFLSVLAVFLLALTGCGAPVLKGVFMDGPVAGLNYATPTVKGVTNADGVFGYKEGETVDFFIGDLLLGKAIGKPFVTPLDIVKDAKNASDRRVANICVLLQTLDQDGNADNKGQCRHGGKQAASIRFLLVSDVDFVRHMIASRSLMTKLMEGYLSAGFFARHLRTNDSMAAGTAGLCWRRRIGGIVGSIWAARTASILSPSNGLWKVSIS